jgi:uncharacterized protein YeaO (DUF488 family)
LKFKNIMIDYAKKHDQKRARELITQRDELTGRKVEVEKVKTEPEKKTKSTQVSKIPFWPKLPFSCKYCDNRSRAMCNDSPIPYKSDYCSKLDSKLTFNPFERGIIYTRHYKIKIKSDEPWYTSTVYNCESFEGGSIPKIRIDCYVSVSADYLKYYKSAHFEFIIRKQLPNTNYGNHVLSPSWNLLKKVKDEHIGFEEYARMLITEINANYAARKRLLELKEISKTKTLFLVCFEKDPNECHRSLVKKMIESLEETQ